MTKRKEIKASTVLMWVFTIFMLAGLIMTFYNLRGKCIYSKYDGLILTTIGTLASICTAVTTNKPANELFVPSE